MEKNDSGESVINMDCFCSDKGCEGNLYIQPDRVNSQRVFMVEVIGSSGDENAYMWLSVAQLEQLREELLVLISEYQKQ